MLHWLILSESLFWSALYDTNKANRIYTTRVPIIVSFTSMNRLRRRTDHLSISSIKSVWQFRLFCQKRRCIYEKRLQLSVGKMWALQCGAKKLQKPCNPYIFSRTRFFYKQRVYKHTQPQIREILSNLLSTPPASDFEIDNKISEKLLLFPKISEKNAIFSKISK